MPGRGDQRHQLVAVHVLAFLVDDDQPVGVAVQRDADIGAVLSTTRRRSRPVSVEPHSSLMLTPLGETPIASTSAPSSQSADGRDLIGGAVGAIDHHLEARQS